MRPTQSERRPCALACYPIRSGRNSQAAAELYQDTSAGCSKRQSFLKVKTAIDQSNVVQEALWLQVKALMAKDNDIVPTRRFIQALNKMIDDQAKRLATLRNRVPNIVLPGLFVIAAI